MSELLVLPGQPYPTQDPWLDVSLLVGYGWRVPEGHGYLRCKVVGNDLELHGRLLIGEDRLIAQLPEVYRPAENATMLARIRPYSGCEVEVWTSGYVVLPPTTIRRGLTTPQMVEEFGGQTLTFQGSYPRKAP